MQEDVFGSNLYTPFRSTVVEHVVRGKLLMRICLRRCMDTTIWILFYLC